MAKYEVSFSCGLHDKDGDECDDGIFLHMDRGDFIIRVANGDDLDALIDSLICCRIEIQETNQAEFSEPDKWKTQR